MKGKKISEYKPSVRTLTQMGIHPDVQSVLDELVQTESVKFDEKLNDEN